MSQIPLIFPMPSLDEIKDFELPKTPTIKYTPILYPEDSFGIPSPLNLSSKKFFFSYHKHSLSDNEISKDKKLLSFKYVDNKKLNSNKNFKKNIKEKEESCFYPKKKKFENDHYDNYFIQNNDDSDNSENINLEKDKFNLDDNENENEEDDDEENLGILKILKNKNNFQK